MGEHFQLANSLLSISISNPSNHPPVGTQLLFTLWPIQRHHLWDGRQWEAVENGGLLCRTAISAQNALCPPAIIDREKRSTCPRRRRCWLLLLLECLFHQCSHFLPGKPGLRAGVRSHTLSLSFPPTLPSMSPAALQGGDMRSA